ncbi:MAG: RDD family protein [Prevotella sp.]|jgi:uncharacterized RDD family membrane protein YckC|nr:RDD family protein [Prevotella sp.]
MENDFNKIMSLKSAEELIKITQIDRNDYQEIAIEAAEKELASRNIPSEEIDNITQDIIKAEIKNTVSSGVRLINFIIDTLVWLVIAFLLTFPLNAHKASHMIVSYFIIIISYILYYSISEIKYQRTLGKFITKTKVVTYNEEIPKNTDIIIRTVCRFIPFDQISFLFTRNGFHDMFSKTKVIKTN